MPQYMMILLLTQQIDFYGSGNNNGDWYKEHVRVN